MALRFSKFVEINRLLGLHELLPSLFFIMIAFMGEVEFLINAGVIFSRIDNDLINQ